MLKYLIFGAEVIAWILWLRFGAHSWLSGLVGVIVIILISQVLHEVLKAR